MQKTLDTKLARIQADPSCGDFILADAKDADMAMGLASPGHSPEHHAQEGHFRTLAQYRDCIRQNVEQGLVDIMLMSASTSEVLSLQQRVFDQSQVTPAIRANDTSDIWLAQGGVYSQQPSQPFRTATIDHAMCGKVDCDPQDRKLGADLGLYSMTFNNDTDLDRRTLEAYAAFRSEAERKGFRHFLEVFNPNRPQAAIPDLGRFLNDLIARTLAGVVGKSRPIFLKIPYHGPAAMEQLCSYDRSLVVGILGGASGTTLDAFHQLWEARKHGARAALYGRMINNSEDQLIFIEHLRWIADGQIDDPSEAVRSYHGALGKAGIAPYRDLELDLISTDRASAYSGVGGSTGGGRTTGASQGDEPDFARMTQQEKVKWNLDRLNRVIDG